VGLVASVEQREALEVIRPVLHLRALEPLVAHFAGVRAAEAAMQSQAPHLLQDSRAVMGQPQAAAEAAAVRPPHPRELSLAERAAEEPAAKSV
jgi:hypothetical protein